MEQIAKIGHESHPSLEGLIYHSVIDGHPSTVDYLVHLHSTAVEKQQNPKKSMTPLWVIASFVSFTELVVGFTATNTTGTIQAILTAFICLFPLLIATAFFWVLWHKSYVFYPPSDFGETQDVGAYVRAMQGDLTTLKLDQNSQRVMSNIDHEISPKPTSAVDQTNQIPALALTKSEETESKAEQDYDFQMFICFLDKKFTEGHEAFNNLIRNCAIEKRKGYEVDFAFLRYIYESDQTGLKDLYNLTKDPQVAGYAFIWLGHALSRSKDYEQAINAFKAALEHAKEGEVAYRTVLVAQAKAKDGQVNVAIEFIMTALSNASSQKEAGVLYSGLAQIYEKEQKHELRAFALEKALECDPSKSDLRFGIGWAYAEAGFNELAALHYATAIEFKNDDWGSLNNFGVALDKLNMPIKAVKYYKKSYDLSNSLAGANLAYKYLHAGFADEAKAIIENSRAMANPHANVGTAWADLIKSEEEEDKKVDTCLKTARQQQKLLRRFCESLFTKHDNCPPFAGRWKGKDGVSFELIEKGDTITADWTDNQFLVFLTGTRTNAGAMINLKREEKSHLGIASILCLNDEASGYAFISPDGSELSILNLDPERMSVLKFIRFYEIDSPTAPEESERKGRAC